MGPLLRIRKRRTPTVKRPRVDLMPFVRRVYIHMIDHELDLVDPDTGLVVYTTPVEQAVGATAAAIVRAKRWLRRHKLELVTR